MFEFRVALHIKPTFGMKQIEDILSGIIYPYEATRPLEFGFIYIRSFKRDTVRFCRLRAAKLQVLIFCPGQDQTKDYNVAIEHRDMNRSNKNGTLTNKYY